MKISVTALALSACLAAPATAGTYTPPETRGIDLVRQGLDDAHVLEPGYQSSMKVVDNDYPHSYARSDKPSKPRGCIPRDSEIAKFSKWFKLAVCPPPKSEPPVVIVEPEPPVVVPEPQPAPIPLPGAGLLLIAGLGALAAMRRAS